MPLITESYDSLPCMFPNPNQQDQLTPSDIDAEPTSAQRAHAQSLIDSEVSQPTDGSTHTSLPAAPEENYSELMLSEFARIAASKPLKGIDLSRYEAIEPPKTSPHSDTRDPATLAAWKAALQQAYTSHVYLSGRGRNLEALNEVGKEQWLAGNEELVQLLSGLEQELARKKEEIDLVVVERQRAQGAVEGELKLLERGWREGVGKVLETEVAAESVRGEILARRRGGAL